jgi:hypothetical protein
LVIITGTVNHHIPGGKIKLNGTSPVVTDLFAQERVFERGEGCPHASFVSCANSIDPCANSIDQGLIRGFGHVSANGDFGNQSILIRAGLHKLTHYLKNTGIKTFNPRA